MFSTCTERNSTEYSKTRNWHCNEERKNAILIYRKKSVCYFIFYFFGKEIKAPVTRIEWKCQRE